MNQGKYLFSQIMELIFHKKFQTLVDRHSGDYKVRHFTCWKQFLCMAFGQLTHRESLTDTMLCLKANAAKLYHLGIGEAVSPSTMTRAKDNMNYGRLYSHERDGKNVRYDQTIKLNNYHASKDYPEKMRRIKFVDNETNKELVFLTDNFHLKASELAQLYRHPWNIELFFKWIKQHLKIKSFWGQSENAVKTQVWIAVSVYVLVAIAKKKFYLKQSLYEILQVLSISIFEKMPINQLFQEAQLQYLKEQNTNQLNLFDL